MRRERETSPTLQAKLRNAARRDPFARRGRTSLPRPQEASIATGDSPAAPNRWESSWFILFCEPTESLFGFFDVVESELPGFHQSRHHRFRPSAEKADQFIDEPVLSLLAGNSSFKDIRVADPLYTAQGFLAFHAVNGCLNRRVSRPVLLRKGLVDFPDR